MSGEPLRGRLVAHPTPGKVWVQVPHRNDIGSDWIEADELPAIAADRATDAGLRERMEALADEWEHDNVRVVRALAVILRAALDADPSGGE